MHTSMTVCPWKRVRLGLAESSDEKPRCPDGQVSARAEQATSPHELAVLRPIPNHHLPASNEGKSLYKHEEPLAMKEERAHERIQFYDLPTSVQKCRASEVNEPNSEEQEERSGRKNGSPFFGNLRQRHFRSQHSRLPPPCA